MNLPALRVSRRPRLSSGWRGALCSVALGLGAVPLVAIAAEPAATAQPPSPVAAPEATADDDDPIISLAAYNVKADRIEDFGLRVNSTTYDDKSRPNAVTFWFTKFAPLITAVVPNTAAAKAGLQPGERILKSEGRSTVGGPFSTAKLGVWYKTQKKKWEEVASGKTNIIWTLEVEAAGTKAVRTVKLVVPTPPPHWGASTWRAPEGRRPAVVTEPGPFAERSRAILDNGIWTLLDRGMWARFDPDASINFPATGYEWQVGSRQEGLHRIFVTQFRGRTDIVLETYSHATGQRLYLTSPSGVLEKAWEWSRKNNIAARKAKTPQAASQVGIIPLDVARVGFEHEVDLWTNRVGKVSGRWPFEVKPGYDANAIFARLAPKDAPAAPALVRPLAADFLKLSPATAAQQALFSDAYGKLGAEPDRWAYTETSRGIEDKRVLVTRVDPSLPEARRSILLSVDGKPPAPADVQRWRDDGGDLPKPLSELPPIESLIDLKDLRIHTDEPATLVFEAPLRGGSAEFPAEKFQALFRISKTQRAFEEIAVHQRDSFRVAGVVSVTGVGLQARFQTFDPAYPPQPILLKAGGGARILLVKISRDFETTRTDYKRVEPYAEPEPRSPQAMPVPGPP